jgi:hypothetical protein
VSATRSATSPKACSDAERGLAERAPRATSQTPCAGQHDRSEPIERRWPGGGCVPLRQTLASVGAESTGGAGLGRLTTNVAAARRQSDDRTSRAIANRAVRTALRRSRCRDETRRCTTRRGGGSAAGEAVLREHTKATPSARTGLSGNPLSSARR